MGTNSFVQVPPDSTGKKLHALQHTVGANTVQAQAMHLADPNNPTYFQEIDVRGAASVRFSEGQPTLSGFGSLNVSMKRALGVYESSAGDYDALFTVVTANGGTNTYDDIGHSMLLTTSTASGSSVKRTTNRYHYYLPGSSNLVIQTIALSAGQAGNARRFGPYDDEDGLYWELDGTTLYASLRSSVSGSVVNTRVAQADWNGDKLDGTGESSMVIDLTKVNLYWIDYQWLGAGRVRFGVFTPDGSRTTCHTFENAGANATPYMRTGTLPLRTENINTGAIGSPATLREVCMAMYTEGDPKDYTFWRAADMDASGVTVGATDTTILAMRSRAVVAGLNHHNSVIAYPETLNVYTDQPVRIDLRQDVTATGGTWSVGSGETSIEGSTNTTLSALTKPFKTWFLPAGTHTIHLTEYFEVNDEGIMLAADDTAEVWAFTGKRLGGTNAIVTLNMGYRELW